MIEIIVICLAIPVIFGIWFSYSLTKYQKPNDEIDQAMRKGRKVSYWKTTRGRKIGARITLTAIYLWILCSAIGFFYMDINISYLGFLGLMLLGIIVIFIISKLLRFDISCSPEELKHASLKAKAVAQAQACSANKEQQSDYMIIPPVIKP